MMYSQVDANQNQTDAYQLSLETIKNQLEALTVNVNESKNAATTLRKPQHYFYLFNILLLKFQANCKCWQNNTTINVADIYVLVLLEPRTTMLFL